MKIFEITLLFLGSVIGAGFATGAEIIIFFGHLNLPIWCISLIVGLTMFAIITLEILLYYPKVQPINSMINPTKTTWLTKSLDLTTIIIYFILFTAMTAGVASITNPIIALISLILSILIVLFGFDKFSRLNTAIVIVIIVLIISTALPHLSHTPQATNTITNHIPTGIFWGFLYAGLNCFMFPELIKASARKQKRQTLLWSAILTAGLITILVHLILTTIRQCHTATATIPLLAAAPTPITIIIILLAVLTSQYTALFAIIQRSQKLFNIKKNRPLLKTVGICLCAFGASFLGFTQIINFAYPLIGAFTCVFLLFSWLKSLRS